MVGSLLSARHDELGAGCGECCVLGAVHGELC